MAENITIAELPLGPDGLDGSNNVALIQPTALIEANNLTFENDQLQKEGGAAKYTSTATAPLATTVQIIGGSDWHPNGSTQRIIIATSDGRLLKDSGAGTFTVTLATGLAVTNSVPIFVEGGAEAVTRNRKLFVFSNGNPVAAVRADPATASQISNPPADWSGSNQPIVGLAHRERIWGAGNPNDPHRLYYSSATDHENYSATAGGGSLSVYPGESEGIIGGISFKGWVVAFKKPRGVYIADTRDASISNWRVDRLNARIGLAGPAALTQVDLPDSDDVMFMDPHGILHLLSRVSDESFGTRDISQPMGMDEWMRRNVDLSRLDQARMVYYAAKKEVHIALTSNTATHNDIRLVVDINRPERLRFRHSDRDDPESMWLQKDSNGIERLALGDHGGCVWVLDQTARAQNGAGYEGSFQTPHVDFGYLDQTGDLATRWKNFKFIEITLTEAGDHDLLMDIYIDESYIETIRFNMGALGDSFPYTFPLVFRGDGAIVRRRKRIHGGGYRLSVRARNSGSGEDFKISQMVVGFKAGPRRRQPL